MGKKGESTRERILGTAEQLVYERGFAGASLDEIIDQVGVTKGGFFYHFKSKGELAHALVERYAKQDYEQFEAFSKRAAALADDPLQDALLMFKLIEEWVAGLTEPVPGCMFASYTYQQELFDDSIRRFVAEGLSDWGALFTQKFEALLAYREPRQPVTAQELTEVTMCIVEGAILLGKVYDDPKILQRQSEHMRNYLQMLFGRED